MNVITFLIVCFLSFFYWALPCYCDDAIQCPSYQVIKNIIFTSSYQMQQNHWMVKSDWFNDTSGRQWYAAILWIPAKSSTEAMQKAYRIQKSTVYITNPKPQYSDIGFVGCDYNGATAKPPGSAPLIDAIHFNQ